jgi:hypothetical protein
VIIFGASIPSEKACIPILAQLSEPVWSDHLPSWVDFITTTSEFRVFDTHSGVGTIWRALQPETKEAA